MIHSTFRPGPRDTCYAIEIERKYREAICVKCNGLKSTTSNSPHNCRTCWGDGLVWEPFFLKTACFGRTLAVNVEYPAEEIAINHTYKRAHHPPEPYITYDFLPTNSISPIKVHAVFETEEEALKAIQSDAPLIT